MYLSLLTLFLFVSYTEPCEEADYVVCYDVPWGEADIVDRVWCTIKCKMTECRSSRLIQAYCVTGFLILSTVDILGLITLSCGGCSVYYRMFRSILDPKPLGPCKIPPPSCVSPRKFPEVVKCLQEGKIITLSHRPQFMLRNTDVYDNIQNVEGKATIVFLKEDIN